MRIKAVLRDSEILDLEPGSRERVKAVATKNLGRPVNWRSLLKVMGLGEEERTTMLDILKGEPMHIYLATLMEQDIVYLSEKKSPRDFDVPYFKWQ